MSWTEEQESDLRRMWHEGHTASVISAQIGKTRNAVCKRARALDLPERRIRNKRGNKAQDWDESSLLEKDKYKEGLVPREENTPYGCQYIYGDPSSCDMKFCGRPAIQGTSWCAYHLGVVYVRG